VRPAHLPYLDRAFILVSQAINVSAERLRGNDQRSSVAHLRFLAMYLVTRISNAPSDRVAALFNRNRSMVSYAIKLVVRRMRRDREYARMVARLEQQARANVIHPAPQRPPAMRAAVDG
jgi:chromosomal replication initiation ATPase DnaA